MSSGINLVMTVIGFTVSIMFIVYMCISLICARIHLYASRRSFPIASRSDLSILERGLHGLEPVVVANFPTKKYGDEFFSAAGDAQCTVCLAEFRSEDVLRILPHCGHSFHVNCIDIWLRQHSTCPVCRISLHDSPKRVMQSLFSSAFQSHYHAESFDSHSYHCMTTDNGLPLRTHDNLGRGPPEEDHFTAEGGRAESGENVAPFSEDNPGIKNSGTKHIEIPSNP